MTILREQAINGMKGNNIKVQIIFISLSDNGIAGK